MLSSKEGTRFIVRPVLSGDAARMLKIVRHEDKVEWDCSVAGGLGLLEACIMFSRTRGEAIMVEDTVTGLPMMIGGVQPGAPGQLLTWLVLAEGCETWGLTFMKDYRHDLDGFFSRWPRTECYSDARNVVHHRWLEYLGYRLHQEVLWGPYDYPFLHFRKGF